MLPLGVVGRSKLRQFANVTFVLIIINIIAFIWELWVFSQGEEYTYRVLAAVTFNVCEIGIRPLPHMTLDGLRSMFLHGGVLHLAGNMLFLWVFGRKIEEYFGAVRYVIFYIMAGYAAIGAHILFAGITCSAPGAYDGLIVGASGAISGILGGFIFLHPGIRIKTLVGLFPPFVWQAKIPALFFLAYWFITQMISVFGWIPGEEATNVAYWAHIGGFVIGFVAVFIATLFYKPAPEADPFAYLDD